MPNGSADWRHKSKHFSWTDNTHRGIVTGKNFYDWKKSNAYYYATHGGFERDFYTYMEFVVVNDNELKRLIEHGMKRKGWKIK